MIPKDLRDLIEDSDDDYKPCFENPDQLLEIFAGLEEKNLFLIQQGQEAEEVLETKIHEYDELKEKTDREINLLKSSLTDVEERKLRTVKDSKFMAGSLQDEENKTLDPLIYMEIEK